MIRLRKILLSNYIYYIFIFLIIIITIFRINYKHISIYNDNVKSVDGIVTDISIDNNKLSITIHSKEDIMGVFYFTDNKSKKYIKENILLGDKILLDGKISRIKKNKTKGLFDYSKYLERKRIFYQIEIDKIYLLSKNNNIIYYIKNKVIERCNNPYLKTFILGDTSAINNNVIKNYRDIGISHLFAISGMHITLLSSIFLSIFKKLKVSELYRYLIVGLFLMLYLFLIGVSPSIVRAILFFIFFSINKIYYLHIKSTNIFITILGLSLLINPYFIYEISFLYSFIISYSLIVLQEYINSNSNYFIKLLKTSFISFIVSIPITLYSFNQINILSILYNLFYVPLVSIIVFPLAIISFIFPKAIVLLSIFIKVLEISCNLLNKIDTSKFIFKDIPMIFYYLYYIFIIIFFKGIISKNYKLTIFIFINLFIHYLIPYFDRSDYLLMIDVGQGDCILIHTNNKNVLIDTGGVISYNSKNSYSIANNIIIPLLKKRGIKRIDKLILTHGDYDHLGEALNLIDNYKVKHILINSNKINKLEKRIINQFLNVDIARKNYYFSIGDAIFLQLNSDLLDENDSSLVFFVTINSKKILLMGDASIKSEQEIMKNYNVENIDILKAGHHGSRTSSGEDFIKIVSPKLILISSGINNKFNHPHKEVIDLYEKYNIPYLLTSQEGSIEISL